MIFFDIDGTLIGKGSRQIPDSAIKAICKARENGHICVINTGRPRANVGEEITGQVEFDGILMGCGTHICYHREELLHQTFSESFSQRIIEELREERIDAILEGAENVFSEPTERLYTERFKKYVTFLEQNYQFASFEEAPGRFDKFYAYVDDRAHIEQFAKKFKGELDFIDREKGFFEIVPEGFSKASAMHFLAGKLNIPMEDTVAIGDSNNDIPMLSCAGVGIAMSNSSKELLAMADYVTTDVWQDGIWNALSRIGVL